MFSYIKKHSLRSDKRIITTLKLRLSMKNLAKAFLLMSLFFVLFCSSIMAITRSDPITATQAILQVIHEKKLTASDLSNIRGKTRKTLQDILAPALDSLSPFQTHKEAKYAHATFSTTLQLFRAMMEGIYRDPNRSFQKEGNIIASAVSAILAGEGNWKNIVASERSDTFKTESQEKQKALNNLKELQIRAAYEAGRIATDSSIFHFMQGLTVQEKKEDTQEEVLNWHKLRIAIVMLAGKHSGGAWQKIREDLNTIYHAWGDEGARREAFRWFQELYKNNPDLFIPQRQNYANIFNNMGVLLKEGLEDNPHAYDEVERKWERKLYHFFIQESFNQLERESYKGDPYSLKKAEKVFARWKESIDTFLYSHRALQKLTSSQKTGLKNLLLEACYLRATLPGVQIFKGVLEQPDALSEIDFKPREGEFYSRSWKWMESGIDVASGRSFKESHIQDIEDFFKKIPMMILKEKQVERNTESQKKKQEALEIPTKEGPSLAAGVSKLNAEQLKRNAKEKESAFLSIPSGKTGIVVIPGPGKTIHSPGRIWVRALSPDGERARLYELGFSVGGFRMWQQDAIKGTEIDLSRQNWKTGPSTKELENSQMIYLNTPGEEKLLFVYIKENTVYYHLLWGNRNMNTQEVSFIRKHIQGMSQEDLEKQGREDARINQQRTLYEKKMLQQQQLSEELRAATEAQRRGTLFEK